MPPAGDTGHYAELVRDSCDKSKRGKRRKLQAPEADGAGAAVESVNPGSNDDDDADNAAAAAARKLRKREKREKREKRKQRRMVAAADGDDDSSGVGGRGQDDDKPASPAAAPVDDGRSNPRESSADAPSPTDPPPVTETIGPDEPELMPLLPPTAIDPESSSAATPKRVRKGVAVASRELPRWITNAVSPPRTTLKEF